MAHHGHTQKSILEAPKLRPLSVYSLTERRAVVRTTGHKGRTSFVGVPFRGDVERDLLGVTVGTSRKGRKIRRAGR